MAKQYTVPIVLPADPVAPMEAATKQYVDANAGGVVPDEVVVGPDDPLAANPDVNLWYDDDAPDAPFGEVAVDVADPGFTVDLWYDPDAPDPVATVDTEWSETEDHNTGAYDEAGTYFVNSSQVGLAVNVDGILETFTIPATSSLLAGGKMQRFTPYTTNRLPIQQRYHNGTAWQGWVPTQDQLVTTAVDFNDITVPGVYSLLGDATNGPGVATAGQLEVRSSDRTGLTVNFAAAGITQAWTDYATGTTYRRSATSGTYPNIVWTPWSTPVAGLSVGTRIFSGSGTPTTDAFGNYTINIGTIVPGAKIRSAVLTGAATAMHIHVVNLTDGSFGNDQIIGRAFNQDGSNVANTTVSVSFFLSYDL